MRTLTAEILPILNSILAGDTELASRVETAIRSYAETRHREGVALASFLGSPTPAAATSPDFIKYPQGPANAAPATIEITTEQRIAKIYAANPSETHSKSEVFSMLGLRPGIENHRAWKAAVESLRLTRVGQGPTTRYRWPSGR